MLIDPALARGELPVDHSLTILDFLDTLHGLIEQLVDDISYTRFETEPIEVLLGQIHAGKLLS